MAIKETLQFVNQNPDSPESREILRRIEDGRMDTEISSAGIDPIGLRSAMGFGTIETPEENENLGTGFKPTFESKEDDNLIESGLKTIGNVPRSGFQLGKDITSAITHPVRTVKALGDVVKGAGGEIGEAFLEKTAIGNQLLEKANESRIERGLPELERNEAGELQAENIPEMQVTEQLGNFIDARYGSLDAFKKSAVEDPVGVLADIAGIVTGTGAAVRAVGVSGKIGKVAQVGSKIAQTGAALEPSVIAGKVGSKIASGTKGIRTTATGTLKDVIPGIGGIQAKNVVKALEFTSGDVKSFNKKFKQNIGEYIADKKVGDKPLLASDPLQTAENAKVLKEVSYDGVREAVAQVTGRYELPKVNQILSSTRDELARVGFGFEDEIAELDKFIGQKDFSMSDAQRIKEVIDERYNLYKKSGDVAAGNKAEALNGFRNELKTLIEKETLAETGVDVGKLNEDVRIAYAIDDAIETGSLKELTRNEFGLNDYLIGSMLGVGVFGGGISLGTAVGLFVAKKTLESPAFRIGVAKGISNLKNNKVVEITNQLKVGTLTDANKAIVKSILQEAEKSAPITGTLEKAL